MDPCSSAGNPLAVVVPIAVGVVALASLTSFLLGEVVGRWRERRRYSSR